MLMILYLVELTNLRTKILQKTLEKGRASRVRVWCDALIPHLLPVRHVVRSRSVFIVQPAGLPRVVTVACCVLFSDVYLNLCVVV
jgi:hypothetical protein